MDGSTSNDQGDNPSVILNDDILSVDESSSLRFRIFVQAPGGWQGYEINPDRSRLVVGSDPNLCDVVVNYPYVLSVQLILNLIEGEWHVVVLGSLETMFVNGVRRRQIILTQNNCVSFQFGSVSMIMNFVNVETADVSHAFRSRIIGGKGYVILNENLPNNYSLRKCAMLGSNELCDLIVGEVPFGAIVSYFRGRLFFKTLDEALDFTVEGAMEEVDSAIMLHPNCGMKIGSVALRFVYPFSQEQDLLAEPDLCIYQIGEDAEKEIVVLPDIGETVTMGRAPENDYVIESNHISRNHAKLTILEGGFKVEDNGSRNGVYVNGDKIDEINAHPGDVIEMGNHRFLLCYDED